jgi:hypothetical protein
VIDVERQIDQAIAVGQSGRLEEAERLLRAITEAHPEHGRAYSNLATALQLQFKIEPALAAARRALELRPDVPETLHTLAKCLLLLNRVSEAADACRRALQLSPDDAEVHGTLARALLVSGDFKRGWAEYEWRWKCPSFVEPRPNVSQPRWNGTRTPGRIVLLHHEQGYGDTIQFVRYAPLAAQRCESVIVQAPGELMAPIRRSMPELADVVPLAAERMPSFDFHAPLMSLPLLFSTTTKTIPAAIPYLRASATLAQRWRVRVADDGARLRVGLAWAGRPKHPSDVRRSLLLATLAPLGGVEGAVFYSLQKWDEQRQAARPPAGMRLVDCAGELSDFDQSAGLIQNLDLVITVDTAVAHLAGAMGKPVWTLLPFSPDFRWMLDRSDSPWYPTMTLLRQRAAGEWEPVIREAAERLGRLVDASTVR